jgi:hypothetical protein
LFRSRPEHVFRSHRNKFTRNRFTGIIVLFGGRRSAGCDAEEEDDEVARSLDSARGSYNWARGVLPPAKIILSWARERGIQRLRSNRIIGLPEDDLLQRWAAILDRAGIEDKDVIVAVLDAARDAADRAGDWRNWSFLTLQIQFAAERTHIRQPASVTTCGPSRVEMKEDQTCVWAQVKNKIRTQVGEIPFMNWFHRTLQTDCRDSEITIVVPDELARTFLENEYRELIGSAVAGFGIQTVLFVLKDSVQ